ncbi:MAG: hypothetical protein Kow00120_24350 [Anaerolineae bacterium]
MTTVIGVFGTQKDLTEALDALYAQGFGDEVTIVDANRSEPEGGAIMVPAASGANPADSGQNTPVPAFAPVYADTPEPELRRTLSGLGVAGETVDYLVRRAKRTSVVVVVQTDEDRATQARDIMQQASAEHVA